MLQHAQKPRSVIRPRSHPLGETVREVWEFRELLWRLAARDITIRYRQTVLGVAWVVLQPLLSAAIFAGVFGAVGRFPSGGRPYFLFALVGMVAWTLFATIVTRGSTSVVNQILLVTRVYFPRILLPLSVGGAALVDLLVGLVLSVILAVAFRIPVGLQLALLPAWALIVVLGAMGCGMLAASLAVRYRDVQYLLPVVVQILLFASPVAYGSGAITGRFRTVVLLNPLTGALDAFRWSLLATPPPNWGLVVYSAIAAVALFIGGTLVFNRRERDFADVI